MLVDGEVRTRAVCPFYGCAGYLELVILQATPGDDETTVIMFPAHNVVGGYSWFGMCPASFMYDPVTDDAMVSLRSMAQHLIRMGADRDAMTRAAASLREPRREHPKAPHPSVDPFWFRSY